MLFFGNGIKIPARCALDLCGFHYSQEQVHYTGIYDDIVYAQILQGYAGGNYACLFNNLHYLDK